MTDGPALLAPQRLTTMLVDRLRKEIVDGRLQAGARLPTEAQLMLANGVSRTVVREAVAELRAAGLVVTQQGRGAFVTASNPRASLQLAVDEQRSLEDVLQVMELRLALEGEIASLAASRRGPDELALIEQRLSELDQAILGGDVASEADFAFHLAIAAASGNPYFGQLLAFLGTLIIPRQRVRWGLDDPAERRRYLGRVQDEHRAIVAAIAAGDPARARQRMRQHLEASRRRYQGLMRGA